MEHNKNSFFPLFPRSYIQYSLRTLIICVRHSIHMHLNHWVMFVSNDIWSNQCKQFRISLACSQSLGNQRHANNWKLPKAVFFLSSCAIQLHNLCSPIVVCHPKKRNIPPKRTWQHSRKWDKTNNNNNNHWWIYITILSWRWTVDTMRNCRKIWYFLFSLGQTKEKRVEKYRAVTSNQGFHCRFIGFSLSINYSFETYRTTQYIRASCSPTHLNTFSMQLLFVAYLCYSNKFFLFSFVVEMDQISTVEKYLSRVLEITLGRSYPRTLAL